MFQAQYEPSSWYRGEMVNQDPVQLADLLHRLTKRLRPGENLNVTLTFQNAGSVTMTIAVGTPEAELPPAPTVSVDPDSESEG